MSESWWKFVGKESFCSAKKAAVSPRKKIGGEEAAKSLILAKSKVQ